MLESKKGGSKSKAVRRVICVICRIEVMIGTVFVQYKQEDWVQQQQTSTNAIFMENTFI